MNTSTTLACRQSSCERIRRRNCYTFPSSAQLVQPAWLSNSRGRSAIWANTHIFKQRIGVLHLFFERRLFRSNWRRKKLTANPFPCYSGLYVGEEGIRPGDRSPNQLMNIFVSFCHHFSCVERSIIIKWKHYFDFTWTPILVLGVWLCSSMEELAVHKNELFQALGENSAG